MFTFQPNDIGGILSGTMSDDDLHSFKPEDVRSLKSECGRMVTRAAARPRTGDEEQRTVEHVASNFDKDRMGDRIDPRGWDLRMFRSNPLLLWGHRDHEPPIGRVVRAQKTVGEDGELITLSRFHSPEKYAFADLVFRMVLDGDLPAVSVGFMPTVVERPKNEEEATKLGVGRWGVIYRKQELLELSVVTVPANAAALAKKLKGYEAAHEYPDHALRLVERYLAGDEPHRSVHRIAQPLCEVLDENPDSADTFTTSGTEARFFFGPEPIDKVSQFTGKEIEACVETAILGLMPEMIEDAVRDGFERGVNSLLDELSGEPSNAPEDDGNGVSGDEPLETRSSLDTEECSDAEHSDTLWDAILEDVEQQLKPSS